MQSFLPYPDFAETARALDYRRLGKQRVEAKQIVTSVREIRGYNNAVASHTHPRSKEDRWDPIPPKPKGWANHPAVLMWAGEPDDICLLTYGRVMCEEWIRRGYVDNMLPWFELRLQNYGSSRMQIRQQPWWMGNEKFHRSHRAALHGKDPSHYAQWADEEMVRCCLECNYWWPTH